MDSNDQFHRLFAASPSATALHELICDAAGRPVDYRFLDVNPAFEAMTAEHEQWLEQLLAGFGREEKQRLLAMLGKFKQALKQTAGAGSPAAAAE